MEKSFPQKGFYYKTPLVPFEGHHEEINLLK